MDFPKFIKKNKRFFALFLLIFMITGAITSSQISQRTAYVEPGLADRTEEMLSIIVTAQDSTAAAHAVETVGGIVTSDLWIINAVAGMISMEELQNLMDNPDVISIVDNKGVLTSGAGGNNYILEQGWDLSADIGADQLFLGNTPILGDDVTIAVLDTGVYSSLKINNRTNNVLKFKEQVDFVGEGACISAGGREHGSFCEYRKYDKSFDPYGHGTHVAGIIAGKPERNTGTTLGIAPESKILSVRVLGNNGSGTYEDVIEGIQYIMGDTDVRVLNLSISATATTPYFIDPLNRAVEEAWKAGIVVIAAAGNSGPGAESITVPGNDPYIITVGSIDSNQTPGDWTDDFLPPWSATGPTLDGFIKPDILAPGANIVSLIQHDADHWAALVENYPDHAEGNDFFRMSGTSMSTAVTSGVVALMLEANPQLTPDQVKFRLMYSAKHLTTDEAALGLNFLQQGAGRIWAPAAVLGHLPEGYANIGMNIAEDLAHGWGDLDEAGNPVLDETELAYHYIGPVRKVISDDGQNFLYFLEKGEGTAFALGVTDVDNNWLLTDQITEDTTWANGEMLWSGGQMVWSGGQMLWSGGQMVWSGGSMVWSGGQMLWSGGQMVWSGGQMLWSGANMVWSGGSMLWSGSTDWVYGSDTSTNHVSSMLWIDQ